MVIETALAVHAAVVVIAPPTGAGGRFQAQLLCESVRSDADVERCAPSRITTVIGNLRRSFPIPLRGWGVVNSRSNHMQFQS